MTNIMSSTFRRKRRDAPRQAFPGTKAWTAGTTLVSTGLREFDAILSAGQPLRTCVVVDGDRFTTIAETLARYWCAEVCAVLPERRELDLILLFGVDRVLCTTRRS